MSVPGISAPPSVQLRLLDLQALDDELARVAGHRRRLQAGTEVAGAEAERTALRREGADQRGRLEDLRTRIGRVEADVRLVEQRMQRDRDRLATTSSPRDAQGLEQEIQALLRRRSALEDDELELMESLEQAESAAAATETALVAADDRVTRLTEDRDEALAGLDAQQTDATARRESLAGELPADLVTLYDRQRTRYGIGAARLVGAVSQGSNMALTGADLAQVRAAAPEEVVLDPESNCILVRA